MRASSVFEALLLVSGVVGLPTSASGIEASEERQRMLVHHNFSFPGDFEEGFRSITNRFNALHPGLELIQNAIDHESFKFGILKDLNTSNHADLYSYWAGAKTQDLTPLLMPIDDLWEKEKLDSTCIRPVISSAATYAGKKYLTPVAQHFVTFLYGKKMFRELKIAPPKNWAEFLSVCERLRRKPVIPVALGSKSKWPAQFSFDYLLLRSAGFRVGLRRGGSGTVRSSSRSRGRARNDDSKSAGKKTPSRLEHRPGGFGPRRGRRGENQTDPHQSHRQCHQIHAAGRIEVRLRASEAERPSRMNLVFEVEDTGMGISEAERERFFDAFVRGNETFGQPGSGLGLAITRQFVELLKGRIHVDSAPCLGSIFRIELPVDLPA